MKAIINGITIEGTPQEILEYQRLQGRADKLPKPKPNYRISDMAVGGYTNETPTGRIVTQ